jgi:hypothetical protein
MVGCRTNWFIRLVLPTPLSPRIMTCSCISNMMRYDMADSKQDQTFKRTFLREDMLCDGPPGAKRVCLSLLFGVKSCIPASVYDGSMQRATVRVQVVRKSVNCCGR